MKTLFISVFFVFFLISGYNKAQTISYVNINASGSNDGSSWANAYTSLNTAISNTVTNRQIWVAKGIYIAPVTYGFQMKNNLAIYGGFDGTETSLAQRNWTLNATTLKGNTNTRVIGNYWTSSYRLNTTAILDGFTITGGTVNSSDFYNKGGAGILNYFASPTLQNLIITDNIVNVSNYYGGGIYNYESNGTMKNVHITRNSAYKGGGIYNEQAYYNGVGFESPNIIQVKIDSNMASYGGGIYNYGCAPYMENDMIINNTAQFDGGGIYSNNSTLINTYSLNIVNTLIAGNKAGIGGGMFNKNTKVSLLNVTLSGNEASNSAAGGIYNEYSNIDIANCIIYLNKKASFVPGQFDPNFINDNNSNSTIAYSIISGQGNIPNCFDVNPQFVDSANGHYNLKFTSQALNSGSNNLYTCSTTIDLEGNSRVFNGVIDMGAYEFQGWAASVKEQNKKTLIANIYPNPAQKDLIIDLQEIIADIELIITDVTGKEIFQTKKKNTNRESIDVSFLQNGIYFLNISSPLQYSVNKIVITNH